MNLAAKLTSTVALALALACGGGSGAWTPSTETATTLVYIDPPGTGWRLVKNVGASSTTHLVLDVVGPTADSGRGVAFQLTTDPSLVTWSKVSPADGQFAQATGLLDLGSGAQLFKGRAQGLNLEVGLFQKGQGNAKSFTGPVARVALDLVAAPESGTPVALTVAKAQVLPATGPLSDITLAVGTLTAQ